MTNNGFYCGNTCCYDEAKAKKSFSYVSIGLIIYSVLSTIFSYAFYGVFSVTSLEFLESEACYWCASVVCCYVFSLSVFYLFVKDLPTAEWKSKGKLNLGELFLIGGVCYFFLYVGNYIGVGLNDLIGSLKGDVVSNYLEDILTSSSLVYKILVVWLIGPFAEELIFRKIILGKLAVFGEKNAVIVSALLFGLFHGNFYQFFYAFGIGLVLGYVVVKTGRMSYSFILHAFINSFSGIVTEIAERADMDWLEAMANEMNAGSDFNSLFLQMTPEKIAAVIYVVVSWGMLLYAVIGGIVFFIKRKKIFFLQAPCEIPKGKCLGISFANVGMVLAIIYFAGQFIESVLA